MSIETLLADLIASVSANTVAVLANNEHLTSVVAGQEAAMAKLDGASGGAVARKPRETAAAKAAREAAEVTAATGTGEAAPVVTPADQQPVQPAPVVEQAVTQAVTAHALLAKPNAEMKKNAKQEDEPTANYRASDFTRQEVKNEFIGWLGDTTEVDERKARAAFVGEVAQHFGVQKPFDPTSGISDPEQLKQTLFFLRRKREGLKVDFSADYNFDGDPLADQSTDAAEDDGMDALG